MPKSTSSPYTWCEQIALPDGHRIFRSDFNRWAIADESGSIPEQTNDGVLWLDFKRPLKIETNVFEPSPTLKEYMFVPLRDEANDQHKTGTNAAALLYLAARFDWRIANETGVVYEVLVHD